MGTIHKTVLDFHLAENPDEEQLIKPFLSGFDVTWARKRSAHNTELSEYILRADTHMVEAYGFTSEIMLVYAPYKSLESRTMKAANSFLYDEPAKGRVDNLTFFLISDNDDVENWIKTYVSENKELRTIVPFSRSGLLENKGDNYYIRKILNKSIYERDLFAYKLPIKEDFNFFGRTDVVDSFIDSIKKCENVGLFGLRKTGKTSILYKLERLLNLDTFGFFYYYDCKDPSIRKLRWYELLKKICIDISAKMGIDILGQCDEKNISTTFLNLIEESEKLGRIVIVFDEIEYISPKAQLDTHWETDFIEFWQSFWSIQSRCRNVCSIVVGVNPYPLEIDNIRGIQNPLFGVVTYQYLSGLKFDDMKLMVKNLGNKMGLKFDHTAINYLYSKYGGHPLLTRIACSITNENVKSLKAEKPFKIDEDFLKKYEDSHNSNIRAYCSQVVSELKLFYPDEYHLLELLASRQKLQYLKEIQYSEQIAHIEGYGLLTTDKDSMPIISIPVIGNYIAHETMVRDGRNTTFYVIKANERASWFDSMKKSIFSDIRDLEKIISYNNLDSIYGKNSFPQADCFLDTYVVTDKPTFDNFLNVCYLCFVESIDYYGTSIGKKYYFKDTIKTTYPSLYDALNRIRVYRNSNFHTELKSITKQEYEEYISKDLGPNFKTNPDVGFILQQRIIEEFLLAIQTEIGKHSS